MKKEFDSHTLMVQYLLGKLNGDEHEEKRELVEQYFEDDELFEEFLNVENELLDKYLRRELAPDDHEAFTRYLKSLPDGRDKTIFAAALTQVITEKTSQIKVAPIKTPSPEKESNAVSLWQAILALIYQPNSVLQYMLIIGFGLMTIGIFSLAIYSYQLHKSNQQFQTQLDQKEAVALEQKQVATDLKDQVNTKDKQIEQLHNELEREKQRDKTQPQENIKPAGVTARIASLEFSRAITRTSSPPKKLVLNQKTDTVLLTVPIKDNQRYLGYEVVLRPTDRNLAPILEQKMKQSNPSRLGDVITFKIAANQLDQLSYKLTLILEEESEEKIASDFYFSVIKR